MKYATAAALRAALDQRLVTEANTSGTDIARLRSRAQMDALDDEHVWTAPLIDMRFNYRPANPLYLLLVRAYRLAHPVTLENTPAYAGCKSWVPLDEPVETPGATPVMDDAAYDARRRRILQRLDAARSPAL